MDTNWLAEFVASPAFIALQGLLLGTFLVFLLGVFAALRDHTFRMEYIDTFVRSTIWGRVAPVTAVVLAGYAFNSTLVLDGGIAAAGVVALGLLTAALKSIQQMTLPVPESAAINPVPKE